MKTMFKKTLVAAALVSLGFAAQAADVTTAVANISKQGSVTGDINAGTVLVKLEAAYAVGDTIKINVTGGLKSAPLTISSVSGAALAQAPANRITLGRTGLDATGATYRVTEVSGAGAVHGFLRFGAATGTADNAAGDNHPDTKLVFKSADVVAAGKVNATYAAFIGNTTNSLDTPVEYNADADLTSGALFNVRDQFVVAVTSPAASNKFDGVLDVADDRKEFTAGTTDVLNLTVTNRSADTGAVAKLNTTFVVKGDFSWAASEDVATVACTGGAQVGDATITASSLTFVCDAATTAVALTLDIDQGADDTVPVSPTSFSVEATQAYGTGSTLALAAVDAGAWTVNGSVVTIPYMAYGTIGTKTFSQIVNLTNNGSQTGTIYADVWATDANGKSSPVLTNTKVGTSNPKSTAKLAGELKKQVEAKGFKDGTVAIRLITDVKADTVSVYSAYVDNGTSERAIVNNDSPVAATKVINP